MSIDKEATLTIMIGRHYSPAAVSDKDISYDPSVIALKDKVGQLQNDLNTRDADLRQVQAGPIVYGREFSAAPVMDDKTAHNHFSRLNNDIQGWVLTHFKNSRPAASPPRELTSTLIRNQPNYQYLMQEPRTRFLILRAIVAENLIEVVNKGIFYGNTEYTQMQENVSRNGKQRYSLPDTRRFERLILAIADPSNLAQWRSVTTSLLSSSPSTTAHSEAISSLVHRIDYSTSSLVNAPASDARLQHLWQIMSAAQQLGIDLAKQRSNFVFERPQNSSMFDPVVMEDVVQEKRAEELKGKKVQSVVFPAVFRFGNSEGQGYGERTVISKAAVLV